MGDYKFIKGKGNRFSKTNQPKNAGRKKSIYKELLEQLGVEKDGEWVKASGHDVHKILARLLMCTQEELQTIGANDRTPIVVLSFISAIREDLDCGRISTIESIMNRVYGTAKQTIEQTTEVSGTLQAIQSVNSRKELAEFLAEFKK